MFITLKKIRQNVAFTLLEVMLVVSISAGVVFTATDAWIDISRQTIRLTQEIAFAGEVDKIRWYLIRDSMFADQAKLVKFDSADTLDMGNPFANHFYVVTLSGQVDSGNAGSGVDSSVSGVSLSSGFLVYSNVPTSRFEAVYMYSPAKLGQPAVITRKGPQYVSSADGLLGIDYNSNSNSFGIELARNIQPPPGLPPFLISGRNLVTMNFRFVQQLNDFNLKGKKTVDFKVVGVSRR